MVALKENAKGRHAQIAVDLGRRWDSKEILPIREELSTCSAHTVRRLVQLSIALGFAETFFYRWRPLANFFEDLGVLHKLGILDTVWINETLGSVVLDFWARWHLLAEASREDPKGREAYRNWERLAEQIWVLRRPVLEGAGS